MPEVELKFQVPPDRRAEVDRAVAGRVPRPRVRLQAAYFDTAERALGQCGLALRVRREGRRWVQTLKGAGDDGLTREEHNVALPANHDPSAGADPSLHAGSDIGERLLARLREPQTGPLQCLYRTDIRRRRRELRTRAGVVELAFDDGWILAGDERLAVCELEIELLRGRPQAVLAAARQWMRRHGLWLDLRTKAERGDMLARGEAVAPPRKARPVRLGADATLAQGVRAVLRSCLDQVAVNASQVAAGTGSDEHVHQLRVGLRRLRTALRLFGQPLGANPHVPPLVESATALFRSLGAARDLAAIAQPMARELAHALTVAGLPGTAPALVPTAEADDPASLMRRVAAQVMLLDLFELTQCDDAALVAGEWPPLRIFVADRLHRWHRRARDDARAFEGLDDASRHRLRKRVKRLRYTVEFAGDLFPAHRVRRYLKPLRALQERLGTLMDLTVAIDASRRRIDDDPRELFAVGWLAARREQWLGDSQEALAQFVRAKPFWKKERAKHKEKQKG